MITLLWHFYRKGHNVRVNRSLSRALNDSSKGWLYICECGLMVTR